MCSDAQQGEFLGLTNFGSGLKRKDSDNYKDWLNKEGQNIRMLTGGRAAPAHHSSRTHSRQLSVFQQDFPVY